MTALEAFKTFVSAWDADKVTKYWYGNQIVFRLDDDSRTFEIAFDMNAGHVLWTEIQCSCR